MKNNLKKVWSKRHSIRLAEAWTYGPFQFKKFWGISFPFQYTSIENQFGTGFLDEKEYYEVLEHLFKKIQKVGFEKFWEKKGLKEFKSFSVFCKKIGKENLSKYSLQKLLKLWKEFIEREDRWYNFMWIIFLLDEILSDKIQKQALVLSLLESENFILAATYPIKKTSAYKQKLDIMNLVLTKDNMNADKFNKKVSSLAKKYAYFSIYNMDEEPLNTDHFKSEIEKYRKIDVGSEIAQLNAEEKIKQENAKNVLKKYKKDKRMIGLIMACRKVAFYREYRNDLRQENYYYAQEIYIEIAKRMNLSISDIIYAMRTEIKSFLEGKKIPNLKDKIQKRKAFSSIEANYKKGKVLYNFNPPNKASGDTNSQISELKGTIAFKGKVSGYARIIKDVALQGKDFKEGEILVSSTTNLYFVPLMSKAKAIVTEEGGLLTHTAIVSRELKKPCIVGTKIATKVLKDGDLVEVDANAGVVKIIERK